MLDGRACSRRFNIGIAALFEELETVPQARGWAGSRDDLVKAARNKQSLAVAQARAGRLEEACRGIEGVIRIYRCLAGTSPARYQPELALSLTACGLWSYRLGAREQAEQSLAEAVALNRDLLAATAPLRALRRVQLRVALAVALSNLGTARSALGAHTPATEAAEEAVQILRRLRTASPLYRMLAHRDPLAFEHCLAGALNNLGVILADRGRRMRAWELAEETAAIYRRLAAEAPVVFESDLARALHNLGLTAAEVGRTDTALSATQEAVYLHRCLLRTGPPEYRQHLGRALCSFARVRAANGRELTEALGAAQEAVRIYEELTAALPQAYSGDLHAAYRTVSAVRTALSSTAHREDPGG